MTEHEGCLSMLRVSPQSFSQGSQDSGFSDSEGGKVGSGYVKHFCKISLDVEGNRIWNDFSNIPVEVFDPSTNLIPMFSSTPKHRARVRPMKSRRNYTSIRQWLKDLSTNFEPECTATLQSKPIARDVGQQVTILTATIVMSLQEVNKRTNEIYSALCKLSWFVNSKEVTGINKLINNIIKNTELFLRDSLNDSKESCNKKMPDETLVLLIEAVKQENISEVKSHIKDLATTINLKAEEILLKQIQKLVLIMDNTTSCTVLMYVLSSMASLEIQTAQFADLMARCSGITSLLNICQKSQNSSVRSAVLRMLATFCCTQNSIKQFEEAGGMEIMSNILGDEKRMVTELCEAASLIAQVTSPWLENGYSAHTIEDNFASLISILTKLILKTPSREMLLVCAAAIANISWAEPRSVRPLVNCSTVGVLLNAIRSQGPKACIFLKEQVATLLANMSAISDVRQHLAHNRAVPALLCFLQVCNSTFLTPVELNASFRVQHKSAIALSRLCSEKEVASQVIELRGICYLARLCKDKKERNDNDGVLVACLATLRKIVALCGRQIMDELSAKELVDPKLLESFFLYSSKKKRPS